MDTHKPNIMTDAAPPVSAPRRRDILRLTGNFAMTGAVLEIAAPLVAAPPARTGQLPEVDISKVPPGSGIKIAWAGQPVFIRHLTAAEVDMVQAVPLADLRDPQSLEERTQPGHREWLVAIAVCPHLGCMPLGIGVGEPRGQYGGFLCPCHGSQFDPAGRVRAGPAPTNLEVPPYRSHNGAVIRLGG